MKIVINGKFLAQRISGVQRYAHELLAEFDKLCNDLDVEIAVPKNVEELPNYSNIKSIKIGKFKSNFWEQISFPRYVKKKKAISLNLCNSAPLRGKKIVTIHDVKIKAHPEFFSKKFLLWYRYLFKNITKKSKAIITVSNFSKREIVKYYGVDPNRVFVISNAWQHFEKIAYDAQALCKYKLEKENYFFSMSNLEPNKNLKWILQAALQYPDRIFAVAGIKNNKIFAQQKIQLPENVKLLGYVSDEEAKTLMRDCKAFIFPTIYEGFGIPPLEAVAAGAKRIIVSDSEVMHEVFGDSAEYISDFDFFSKSPPIHKFEEINKANLLRYSWEESSKKLYEILNDIVK